MIGLAAGDYHTCALTRAGDGYCWGGDANGQLGDGRTEGRPSPARLVRGLRAMAGGGSHTCAITRQGSVTCWGGNAHGQLGHGPSRPTSPPGAVEGLGGEALAATAGSRHTCALTAAGGVRCWGFNGFGQLGDGSNDDRPGPVVVVGLSAGVTAIRAGHHHTCALLAGGEVACWGDNHAGQLGDGTTTHRAIPVRVGWPRPGE